MKKGMETGRTKQTKSSSKTQSMLSLHLEGNNPSNELQSEMWAACVSECVKYKPSLPD